MLKPVIAATAMLAIAGSTFVYAQQGGYRGFRDGGARFEHRHRLSADDVSAFADARIAALKAGLELTSDQTKNWPAFEAALRNMVQLRIDRIKARQAAQQQGQAQTPGSPFDRMAKRADAMSKRSVALKQIADAGAPLYQSLNDAQKARFTSLARMLRPHQHGFNGGERREGRNFDRDGRGHDGRGQEGHGWGGRRFGENGPGFGQGGQDGQDGQDGRGWRHGHMHNLMNSDGDQGSQL
jgi:zinc resistance-associated protein